MVGITQDSISINHHHEGHAPQFEEVHLLFVAQGHLVIGIGQSDKRQVLCPPIHRERRRPIRADGEDLGPSTCELRIVVAKARQLRAAVWSEEAAQKCEDDGPATEIREADNPATCVANLKIRGALAESVRLRHGRPVLWHSSRSDRTWPA